MPFRLVSADGQLSFELRAGLPLVLGRALSSDLPVLDPTVSRRHAELTIEPSSVLLKDLGSSNGTFVNGSRVESALLEGGEQIQLGDTVLVSSQDEPAATGATQIGSLAASAQTPSAIHRMLVRRSLRRLTALALTALGMAAGATLLLASGVLSSGDAAQTAVQRVVQQVAPSTVLVEARRDGRRVGTGTGWVLDGAQGLVVTSAHVVNGATSMLVGVGSELTETTVVAVAPCEDLAVLRAEGTVGLRSLPLGDQSSLEQGETVVAVGYPANASTEANLTSTTGVVSIVRTAYREPAFDVPRYSNVVQTDAAFNPGSSGGPLVDLDARLVGVETAVRRVSPEGRVIEGQNYAIGVDRVKEVVAVLRTGRSIGWAGLGFGYPSELENARRGAPAGLLVSSAFPGTSAHGAGLGDGSGAIVAVNGMPVGSSLSGYCDAVSGFRSGDRVALSVLGADSRQREIPIDLE